MNRMRGYVLVLCCLVLSPTVIPAASGLSDIAATEACWIREPYALIKCQSERGRYPARLVRARPATPKEESFFSLVPVGYEGIVPIKTLVSEVDRIAIMPRFLIVRELSGSFVVVDLNDPERAPLFFANAAATNGFLVQEGSREVYEREFRKFDAVYREYKPRNSSVMAFLIGSVGLVAISGLSLLRWKWIRRTSPCSGPAMR